MKKIIAILSILLSPSLYGAEAAQGCTIELVEKLTAQDADCAEEKDWFCYRQNSGFFEMEAAFCLRAKIENKPVGLVFYTKDILGYDAMNIDFICVHPDHRKQGIGSQLLEEIHKRTRCKCITLASVYEAINFYRKNGFKATHRDGREYSEKDYAEVHQKGILCMEKEF